MVKGSKVKKVKYQTTSNCKTNSINMLALGKHANVLHSDLFICHTVEGSKVIRKGHWCHIALVRNEWGYIVQSVSTDEELYAFFFYNSLFFLVQTSATIQNHKRLKVYTNTTEELWQTSKIFKIENNQWNNIKSKDGVPILPCLF